MNNKPVDKISALGAENTLISSNQAEQAVNEAKEDVNEAKEDVKVEVPETVKPPKKDEREPLTPEEVLAEKDEAIEKIYKSVGDNRITPNETNKDKKVLLDAVNSKNPDPFQVEKNL
ncbi:hypothetical protein A3F08_01180 [Candidatus Berkelbacteria bacterium RIFCSPHIGHO2_12_FULL_36_9]|uniref:Uncharacterized protein n=1 Tax=Candidatus Berkelbacteria bacterium RIFCSPHIGHO2_12_FULL_36_9 TaxID=1797469 RepID=A0A1F5EKW5_9BACT|nr:MAG: hypothetical protein A3F08_01180 [Candidatus Berkelbacteria bacterium RIFCSPHIGHO2_12_FULL_36_9]